VDGLEVSVGVVLGVVLDGVVVLGAVVTEVDVDPGVSVWLLVVVPGEAHPLKDTVKVRTAMVAIDFIRNVI